MTLWSDYSKTGLSYLYVPAHSELGEVAVRDETEHHVYSYLRTPISQLPSKK